MGLRAGVKDKRYAGVGGVMLSSAPEGAGFGTYVYLCSFSPPTGSRGSI
jgi:hypothetical protein